MPLISSFPFLLIEKACKTKKALVLRNVIALFSIYNSAAYEILYKLKCQYLFDELEAELNVCLNKLVLYLSQRIYIHYRTVESMYDVYYNPISS